MHPAALETIYQSLSSLYDAQVLIASQSPLLLGMAEPEQLLCFTQEPDGTRIIRGSEHPALRLVEAGHRAACHRNDLVGAS